MKAQEVLKRYRAGERDFRGVNLQGESFKGKDLSEADFSEADIRGTNFTKANLKGTNFSHVKAGLQKYRVIVLLIVSFLLSTLSGFILAIAGVSATGSFESGSKDLTPLAIVVSLVVFAIFFIVAICQGFLAGVVAVVVAVTVLGAVTHVFVPAPGPTGFSVNQARIMYTYFAAIVALSSACLVVGTVVGAVAIAIAGAVAGTVASTVAVLVAVFVAIFVAVGDTIPINVVPVAVAVAVTLLSAFIGWRALAGDKKQAFVRNIAFAVTGGTNFCHANLTDANFTKAILKNTDFRKAIVTGTHFSKAKSLSLPH